jgi:hypothetical protein
MEMKGERSASQLVENDWERLENPPFAPATEKEMMSSF